MSVLNFNSDSFSNRLSEIELALNTKSNKIVNDRLELVKKENGFLRFLKVIILPFARVFWADSFAHTRAKNVALVLFSQYLNLKTELQPKDMNRLSRIIKTLHLKTKGRYQKYMDVYIKIIPVDPSIPAPTFDTPTTHLSIPLPPTPPPLPPKSPPVANRTRKSKAASKPNASRKGLLAAVQKFDRKKLNKIPQNAGQDGSTTKPKKKVDPIADGDGSTTKPKGKPSAATMAQLAAAAFIARNARKARRVNLNNLEKGSKPKSKEPESKKTKDPSDDPWAAFAKFGARRNKKTTPLK